MDFKPWLDYYPEQVPSTLNYPNVSLSYFLTETASTYPQKEAIHFMGKSIDYRQLLHEVKVFASALRQIGVCRGERVAIMLPNCPQAVIAYYGVLYMGAIVVQTNPLYMERELIYQMNDSGSKVIVCLDLLYEKVKNVRHQTQLERIIVTGIHDYFPLFKQWAYPFMNLKQRRAIPALEVGDYAWQAFAATATPMEEACVLDPEEDLALLQYTGGTTGQAKGVMLTHSNLVANVTQCIAWFYRLKIGKERFLAVIPFFHVYGMTVAMNLSIRVAGSLVILPRFNVLQLMKTIQKEKPTLFPGAPTMYIALVNHPQLGKYNLSSIEACISGSAPLPKEVQDKFEAITGGRLVEGYGLTETSPVIHVNPIWERRKTGSVGLPWPDTEVKITDIETGKELPPGQIGELFVKGPQVMKGYWNRPEATKEVLQEGWLATGDMAYMDEEGYFYLVDRKKDVIIAGGFNIYPREIEEVLYEHKMVSEAVVVGIPDAYRGETVKAFIVLKNNATVSEQELDHFCRERLAAYKVPRVYEFRQELPKTAVGKVLRRMLVEEQHKG